MEVVEERGPEQRMVLRTHVVLSYGVEVEELEVGGEEGPEKEEERTAGEREAWVFVGRKRTET